MELTWPKFITGALSVLVAVTPFALKAFSESRAFQFTAFHGLIKDLVQSDVPGSPMDIKIDRQIAVIYELRRFWRYHPVTIRILTGLNAQWSAEPTGRDRLFLEIHKTIRYAKKRLWIQKLLGRD